MGPTPLARDAPATLDPDLLRALKALSDASRLRIVGLLAGRPMAVQQLAEALELTPGTVVHHLNRLREAGLVDARADPPYAMYRLLVPRLQEIGRALDRASHEHVEVGQLPGPDGRPRDAFDAKVLRSFFMDGRLTSIPAQHRKRLAVLRYLTETVFPDEGERIAEKELDMRIALIHPDVAALRRYLVDEGFATREHGI